MVLNSYVIAGGAAGKKEEVVLTEEAKGEGEVAKTDYEEYIDFFEEVYGTIDTNYYHEVVRENFNRFIDKFDKDIYGKLQGEGKSSDYIKWRSAAYLVDYLKNKDDIFSKFLPPKPAKKYEQTVLGKRIDLGIEGKIVDKGFEVTRVEPRADAYEKGLRVPDVILKIDDKSVIGLEQKEIETLLTPLENEKVVLSVFDVSENKEIEMEVVSKEYFKQFVFMVPVPVPGIYCLKIERFNRMTAQDMTGFMSHILKNKGTGLIIDLRGNPGGPPLAAREISSFFLPPAEDFAHFYWKNKPKAVLDVPRIPERYHYKGDIIILVDKKSGSASELFSGILQKRGRAAIMGTNTAGQVLLKSMFYFDDESMVLLVTARGHHPDGEVFSYDGVRPNEMIHNKDADLLQYAAYYLIQQRKK